MSTSTPQGSDIKGKALIVDDLPVNRKILEGLLKYEGYLTLTAEDGQQAVELFNEHQPDIVFMDVMMPVMDGYEATKRIKALTGSKFVPVIFLTALSEADAMVKCIEAGGDDFLGKPFKQEILSAKIKAIERIRDLSRTVEQQNQILARQHSAMLNEQLVAERIYRRAVTDSNYQNSCINSLLRSASIFSGDMLLTAKCPDGGMHILLGDFTGHGLVAAVGVLPTAEIFRSMTEKGSHASEIIEAINGKLKKLLPTGIFLSAGFVAIDADMKNVSIWNAGIPDMLILTDKKIKHRVKSLHLPLGIVDEIDKSLPMMQLEILNGDRILMCSDGLNEATNENGEGFGMSRYEQAATSSQQSFQSVLSALDLFCGQQTFADDVSFVEIECVPALLDAELVRYAA